ncbi:hypothetical protein MKY27_11760 [Solibacillus sp. FSL R5-0449]|uniref:hypothetical protein n=1 Tax=Solibacillus sp. FSL R5-0449 TaxID=2921639 RepID=UPI0030CC79A9
MGIKITGLNKLKQLSKGLEEVSNTKSIPITELLTNSFLAKNTRFSNFSEFESSEIFKKYKDIEDIPDQEMDEFIMNYSDFTSWENMLHSATEEYIKNKLNF